MEAAAARQGKAAVTEVLVGRTVAILQDEINLGRGFLDFPFWSDEFSFMMDAQPKQTYFTPERSQMLLARLWEQRELMVTTLAQSPVPGFGAILLIISSNTLEKPNISKDE